jgi:bacterioferritin
MELARTANSIARARSRDAAMRTHGAVTPSYDADIAVVLKMLDAALATELICVLRYRSHAFTAQGILAESVRKEFLEHSGEEQVHADQIATRMVQLGGTPNFDPATLMDRAHASFGNAQSLLGMVAENLIAERTAIDTYRQMIQYLKDHDSTTRRMLEEILAKEEEHAEDLASLMLGVRDATEQRGRPMTSAP